MKRFFIILSFIISAQFVLSACSSDSDSGSTSGTPPPAPVYDISVTPTDSLLLKNGEAAKSVAATVTRDGAPAAGVTLTASGIGLSFRPAEGETDEDGICVFEVSAATDTQTSGVITISGEALSSEAFVAELGYTVVETNTLTELWGGEITYLAFTMEGLESDTFTVTTPPERSIRMRESIILNGAVIAVVNEDGDLEFSYDKGFLLGSDSDSYIEYIRVIIDGGEPSLLAVRINVTNGSREYPYPIRTKKELQAINYNVKGVYPNLNKHFILMNDISIDEDSDPWTPIGVNAATASQLRPFSGYFNGNNHSITDLTDSLFQYIKPDVPDPDNPPVVVEKLHLETPPGGTSFTGTLSVGLLAGRVDGGIIQYVSADGTVNSTPSRGGVFIEYLRDGAILRRCYSTVNGSLANYNTGLLVSSLNNAQIEDCYTTGSISFSSGNNNMSIGGIASVTSCSNEKVYNTYTTGRVGGPSGMQGGYGGGILGIAGATGTIDYGCEVKNSIALIDYIRIYGAYGSSANTTELRSKGVARVCTVERPGYGTLNVTLENNYAYEDMDISSLTGDAKTPVDDLAGADGMGVEPTDLTADFFTRDAASSGLGWSGDIWDFDFADTERSWKLPIIKGYREAEQKALCLPVHLQTDPGYTTDFPHCL